MSAPRLVTLGTISGGGIAIQADVTTLGSDVAVAVLLSTDYLLANPRPSGFPIRPEWTGGRPADLGDAGSAISAGITLRVLGCEAAALIAAGAATRT